MNDVRQKIGSKHPDEKSEMESNLLSIGEEEKRAARLYAVGKITDHIWDSLWRDWQDRRHTLQANLEALQHKSEYNISHLNDTLHIISKISVLDGSMELRDQKRLLREVVNKVVVNEQGSILELALLSPSAYLRLVSERIGDVDDTPENKKASKCWLRKFWKNII